MTEALRIAPEITDGLTPRLRIPNLAEIPFRLRRKTLKQVRNEEGELPEKLWEERGDIVEARVKSIIESQTDIVANATIRPLYAKGSDLIIEFTDGFQLKEVFVEVKSSNLGIRDFKHKIRDNLPKGQRDMDGVKKWMTENRVILINGSEEKTPEEILNDSFYPQLERIKQKALIDRNIEVQIFPEVL